MNTQKGFSTVLGLLLVLIIVGGSVYFYVQKNEPDTLVPEGEENIFESVNKDTKEVAETSLQDEDILLKNDDSDKLNEYKSNFGFGFSYPSNWSFIDDLNGSEAKLKPPYLFDGIMTTQNNHPINRAGHVSVLNMNIVDAVSGLNKNPEATSSLRKIKTKSFEGYSYKIGQTYGYVLEKGDSTIMIDFRNDVSSEFSFTPSFISEIEMFVLGFYKL